MTVFLETCLAVSVGLVAIALVLTAIRVLRGPTEGDRIVAIDLFGVLAVAMIAIFAIWLGEQVFLDAAIALALVAFFGTIAYARFVEHKAALKAKEPSDG
ncbi:hypothetical protein CHU95_12070 [Niveispirillum lacus]|uniref:Cation:proton antiporter n=1 Tax=Niveispirillum lacus TaxID=1981099 RepID=A0A255YY78_9PROT|nr:monovalent cation/H+ antiporter complex subunit F [Niveispirillum lacus]OYQ34186.1 hypothetical protein CHU95_12070 [Niveispirillum lacus]